MEFVDSVNGGKEYKASRLGGLECVRGEEKMIIRARKRNEEKPLCSSRLSRSCFTLSRAYESCFACRMLISNWIDRCFSQHLWNSAHSLSTDNPQIPTNPLSGSQRPPLLWGQWIRTKPCSKLTRLLRLSLIQTEVTFQLHRTWRSFFADGIIRCLLYDDFLWPMLVCNAYIWAFFVRIYMRVCKKMVIYSGIKTPQSRKERKYTWQKNARISFSRNDCKYMWEKTTRISFHNFETNGRP